MDCAEQNSGAMSEFGYVKRLLPLICGFRVADLETCQNKISKQDEQTLSAEPHDARIWNCWLSLSLLTDIDDDANVSVDKHKNKRDKRSW
jgi:hypothetical protein